jgi:phosphoserine aminotransferase
MIPMNFLSPNQHAGYIVSGIWSKMALQEAARLKNAYCVASTEQYNFSTIPEQTELHIKDDSTYIYYTPNETVNGVRIPYLPKVKNIPLIADMTSCLLSEPIDVKDYDLIFAGAQKNIANAGLTLVIVKDNLLNQEPNPIIPTMLHYKTQVEYHSLYATPPVFNCYLAAKMFDWIKEQGGVDALYGQNCRKAAKLYQYLDSTDFYTTPVHPEARSIMNICFSINNKALEGPFLERAKQRGLYALQGHRFVGGIRASLYNAMPLEGVEHLVNFMTDFAKEHN